jgi:hypothetical protein
MSALDAALALVASGLPCFPCLATKAPACPSGFKAATTDPMALRELWRRYSGELIGVPTGEASRLAVLDIDIQHATARHWWPGNRARLLPTRVHRTRSRGLHLLFRHASGIRNSAAKIALGIDVRAEGGYIIWWPAAGLPVLADGPLAPWPAWLLADLQPPPAPSVRRAWWNSVAYDDKRRRYAIAGLRHAVERVATAPDGTRNDTLNRETFGLARFLSDGSLAIAARHAGLGPAETAATLASALRAGGGA